MFIVLGLLIIIVGYGWWEFRSHQKNLRQIPIRVHVNGSRGKSSVTRLIAAGLRAGGIKALAKTTGTKPRLIFEDGTEVPIIRAGKPNVIEQTKIFSRAVSRGAEALVVECMAVDPVLQQISEQKMVKATVGVITNVRPDHLDQMGKTLEEVAQSLAKTIPKRGVLYTCEKKYYDILEKEAQKENCQLRQVQGEGITPEMLAGFSYMEHKDNLALALAVCEHLGVDPKLALAGMQKATPDSGALRIYKIHFYEKELEFVNAFAANDNDSYEIIWKLLAPYRHAAKKTFVLVNARPDRIQRSEALAELIASKLDADRFLVVGDYTTALINRALAKGVSQNKISNWGGYNPEEIFENIVSLTPTAALIVGIGNIVGLGEEIVQRFSTRGVEIAYGRN